VIVDIIRRNRMRAYKEVFRQPDGSLTPAAEVVLADLKKFCRADRSTHSFGGKPTDMAVAEGRREVWLRLMSFLNMTEADFYHLKEEIYNDGTGARSTTPEPDFY
jgi:hypothetical protein